MLISQFYPCALCQTILLAQVHSCTLQYDKLSSLLNPTLRLFVKLTIILAQVRSCFFLIKYPLCLGYFFYFLLNSPPCSEKRQIVIRVRPHTHFCLGSEIWNWSENFVSLWSEKKPDFTWFISMQDTKNLKRKWR